MDYAKIKATYQKAKGDKKCQEVIKKIREIRRRGLSLGFLSVGQIDPSLYRSARTYFGSWRKAVESAGIDYASASRRKRTATRSHPSKKRQDHLYA